MNPRFPIYIPSKGRADSRLTVRALEAMRVPYRIIVEQQEFDTYAKVIDPANILVLDPAYQDRFNACIPLEPGQSKGSGPARNFAWDHAVESGEEWHWIIDDNVRYFCRLFDNKKINVGDGTVFRCMEDFVLRYENIALAGPNYQFFAKAKQKIVPVVFNTRVFSCILIRNVDLSLRALKAGWCTAQFNAFLQGKTPTQQMKGGNTDAFYAAEGTLPKSKMIVRLHPDVARLAFKFGRWHHHVDYRPFQRNRLVRRKDVEIPEGVNDYGMRLVKIGS
jgi:hypothetical protein